MSKDTALSVNMSTNIADSWDDAITDAENELSALRKRQRHFQYAIRIFKANKRDKVPWPGSCTKPRKA
jgi:hypothetical protein